MHLTTHLKTLTLLGTLATCHSPSAAQKTDSEAQLGYLKCVSAVMKTTSFPSCASSYKLDCFCEAQAQARTLRDENGLPIPSPPTSTIASSARLQLEPEVEDLCAENGVPKEGIARYLCDDTAVPASPRRGSTPMVRLGKANTSDSDRDSRKQITERSIDPNETRLLIPENDPSSSEESDDAAAKDTDRDEEDRITNIDTDLKTFTLTVTETVCACESEKTADADVDSPSAPTPTSDSTEDPESESEPTTTSIEPHPVHGTEIAVAILSSTAALPTPTSTEKDGYAKSSSSVRLSSSSVIVSEPVPTGVDGTSNEHGTNHEEPGSEEPSATDAADVFEGGAMVNSVYVSRAVVVGVLGVLGAGVLV
ncbi:extracellular serine rich protein [Aspergillus stella-maris]|uniref:extracellular serine rich protein n=1 Tax=Aspergillus stella-maris TaxID=1810926 RepID=UPI003CCD7ADF